MSPHTLFFVVDEYGNVEGGPFRAQAPATCAAKELARVSAIAREFTVVAVAVDPMAGQRVRTWTQDTVDAGGMR